MAMTWVKIGIIGLAFAAGWFGNGWRYQRVIAQTHQKAAQDVLDKTKAITQDNEEIVKRARNEADKLRIDNKSLDDTVERLRQQVARQPRCPTTASGSDDKSGGSADHLPSDLSARLATAARDLAKFADRMKLAGETCERVYESVR